MKCLKCFLYNYNIMIVLFRLISEDLCADDNIYNHIYLFIIYSYADLVSVFLMRLTWT